jgi:hypothetical protein
VSYSEVKALANGNPLLIDKARADAELERAERDWHDILLGWGRVLHVVRHEHLATPIVNTVAAVRFRA